MTKPIAKWATFVWPADEEWRPVIGFHGYKVSDHGRIRSLRRANARLMTPEIDKDGYSRVALIRDGRYEHQVLSRLVAMAFIGPCPDDKPYCCHDDGARSNNRPSNLRWDTQAGNIADKRIHGTEQKGSRHPNASIDEAIASQIKHLIRSTPKRKGSLKGIAQQLGVSYQVVSGIAHKGGWSHVC